MIEIIKMINRSYIKLYNLLFIIIQLPARIYKQIKWFYQRGKRGYADCDLWSFDAYLGDILYNGIKEFRKNKISYPMSITSVEWDRILRAMETGFQYLNKDNKFRIMFPNENMTEYRRLKINKDFKKDGLDYRIITINEVKKIQRAFHLLEKHFNDLWD